MKIVYLLSSLALVFSMSNAKERNWKNANEAYAKICAHCHDTGVGVDSVKIKFPDDAVKERAEHIFHTVRHGMYAMPAFRQTEIDDETLKELSQMLAKGKIK